MGVLLLDTPSLRRGPVGGGHLHGPLSGGRGTSRMYQLPPLERATKLQYTVDDPALSGKHFLCWVVGVRVCVITFVFWGGWRLIGGDKTPVILKDFSMGEWGRR